MAQTGYTPILIYSSSTASNAPAAGNLTNSTLGSELAINITDGKLFYKDNANAIQVIGWKTTPTTAGGTGLTSYTAGDLLYYATGTTLSKLAIGASTTILTSSGTAPQWSAASGITVGKATNLDGGLAGSVPYQSGAGATTFLGIGAANTVMTSSGSAPQWTAQSSLAVGTASNLLSNATTGVMQITGPGTGTTRVMTIPNANFTAARTDAGQTFSGTQEFAGSGGQNIRIYGGSAAHQWDIYGNGNNLRIGDNTSSTGQVWFDNDVYLNNTNVVQGTAGKGINFTANTSYAGKTSQLLNYYEEGTWTPTATNITGTNTYSGTYTRIGNRVYWEIIINTSSSITMTSASSTLSLPSSAAVDNTCVAANRSTGAGFGTGLVTGSNAWPPTAAPSAAQSIVVSGSYKV